MRVNWVCVGSRSLCFLGFAFSRSEFRGIGFSVSALIISAFSKPYCVSG